MSDDDRLRFFEQAGITALIPFDATAYGLAPPAKAARKKPKAAKAPRGPAPGVRDNVREFLKKGA